MAALAQILGAPGLRGTIHRIGGFQGDAEVETTLLIESLGALVRLPPNSLAVLSKASSEEAAGYRLDMALKLAASRGAVAVLLTDARADMPATSAAIAEHGGIVVLSMASEGDLAATLVAIEREISGDAAAALARIEEVIDALSAAEFTKADAAELTALIAPLMGSAMRLGEPADDDVSCPVLVEGEVETHLCVSSTTAGHGRAVDSVAAALLAGAIGRAKSAARRAEDVPIRSRGQLLAEFLLAAPDRSDRLLDRMRAADLGIDGWHVVIQVELENPERVAVAGELPWYHVNERISSVALDHARPSGGVWDLVQLSSAFVLVRTTRRDPGASGARELIAVANSMLHAVLAQVPEATLVCGAGRAHVGAVGLRTSAAEARAALAAARAGGRPNEAVAYDHVGLERTLLEWYGSDTAREAVDSLLTPLDKQKPVKRDQSILTLKTYLDNQGSLSRTADEMHLHRNAVAYRVDRIFAALGVDRSDPDTRLLLQLACRVRSLG